MLSPRMRRIAVALALVLLVPPGTARAADDATMAGVPAVALDWEVAYGGVAVADFRFDSREADGHYALDFSGRTVGLASALFPAAISASTVGTLKAGLPVPALYLSQSTGRRVGHARLSYRADGPPDAEITPRPGTDADGPTTPVPPDSLIDTVDPLSSLLALAGSVDAAKGCAGTIRVFDGRRRYDLVIRPPGDKDIATRSGPYQDLPALRCGMHVVPIGGYPIDRKKALADDDSVFWVAAPPGMPRTVPIEIAFSGRWGVLRAYLLKPPAGP